jgi:hypothetical protein
MMGARQRLWRVCETGVSVSLLAGLTAGCGLASKDAGKRGGSGSGAAYAGSLPGVRLENPATGLDQAGKSTEILLLRNSKLRRVSG